MKPGLMFSEDVLARVRDVCRAEPRIAALYAFDPEDTGDYQVAALYGGTLSWPERLDLEMAVAQALGLEGVEIIDMRRMPLVFRFDVLKRGEPLFVGHPEKLAIFIEETVVRYSSYYPLLEALYWTVQTRPLAEDQVPAQEAAPVPRTDWQEAS
jgi:hypothetical protein